jgi:hypothetical protein
VEFLFFVDDHFFLDEMFICEHDVLGIIMVFLGIIFSHCRGRLGILEVGEFITRSVWDQSVIKHGSIEDQVGSSISV